MEYVTGCWVISDDASCPAVGKLFFVFSVFPVVLLTRRLCDNFAGGWSDRRPSGSIVCRRVLASTLRQLSIHAKHVVCRLYMIDYVQIYRAFVSLVGGNSLYDATSFFLTLFTRKL